MTPSPDISICIVNWNTRQMLDQCLASLAATTGDLVVETIVVDNASTDGSAAMVGERYPTIVLIANSRNLGYARANNQALERATGPAMFLLNPDTVIHSGAIQELLGFLAAHPSAGAVAPRLVYPDGRLQYSCRSFPTPDVIIYEALGLSHLLRRSRRFGKYRMTWWDHREARTVEQPMASALLLRREAIDQVGPFDEQFPIYFNDVDLCKRLWEGGWEIWYDPQATLTHYVGGSTSQRPRMMIAESHRSFLRFYRKHYFGRVGPAAYMTATALLRLGGLARGAGWISGGGLCRQSDEWASGESHTRDREAPVIDDSLLEILACPACKGAVTFDAEREQIVCGACCLRYPIRDGIPIMLVDEAHRDTPENADH